MSQSDFDPSTPITAMLAEPPEKKSRVGCIIALVLTGFGGLLLLLMAAGVYLLLQFESLDNRGPKQASRSKPSVEARQDIEQFREIASKAFNAKDHPQYDRIVAFVDDMQAVLDDTPNPGLQELIDYDLYVDELMRRSDSMQDNPLRKWTLIDSAKHRLIGPTCPLDYEILRIESDKPGRYLVYLSCSENFGTSEPYLWWLSDRRGLKIYDWSQLELGMRESRDDALLNDANLLESIGYQEYADLCYEYLGVGEKDLSYVEQTRRIEEILTKCESFRGPQELKPSVDLITARRWYYQGERERALTLMERIVDPDSVPGVYSLTGKIHFDRGDYQDAVNSYTKYVELLGPTRHVQRKLVDCYRELGDTDSERQALLALTESIDTRDFDAVAQLLALNDESQNQSLFSRLDSLPIRDSAYRYLINYFQGSAYFAFQYQQILEHVRNAHPESEAAIFASIGSDPDVEQLADVLNWIDEQDAEASENLRFEFWYEMNESQVPEVFESSSKRQEDFATIGEIYDYEGTISDDSMLAVCESFLKSNPDDCDAHYRFGVIQNQRQDFDQAITSLRKSLANMPPEHEERAFVGLELLRALYNSGDKAAALEFATDQALAEELLALHLKDDDYSGFEELLRRIEGDSNSFKYYQALLLNNRGETEAALRALADLVNAMEQEETPDFRVHSYRAKLVDLCEQQNDIAKAYRLAASEAMFEAISDRLIEDLDWQTCEHLLDSDGLGVKELQRVQLRQRIDWEQGDYENVVKGANAVLELARRENMTVELERLVRACLRLKKFDEAKQFADAAAILFDRDDLVALVSLRLQDAQPALRALQRSQSDNFWTDLDLIESDWRDVIPSSQRPLRNMFFAFGEQELFELQMLFSAPQELQDEQLQNAISSALGAAVHVERVVAPGDTSPTWVVQSKPIRFFISYSPFDGIAAAKLCDVESLQQWIGATTFQLSIVAEANTPTTAKVEAQNAMAIIKCFANEDLQAVGKDYRWLGADDVTRYLKQTAEQRDTTSYRLFGRRDFKGEFAYFEPPVEPQDDQGRKTFLEEWISALKQFEASTDIDKTLVVQFSRNAANPERIQASVHQVRRTGYGTVTLICTVVQDAKYDPSVREGDRIAIYPESIERFELRGSGIETKLDRFPD